MFLVFLNGFFVLAEFALVKIRKTRLDELVQQGNRRAKTAREVTGRLDAYLSACQLGITLASLGLGWLGEPAIASLIVPLFAQYAGWGNILAHTVAGIIAFVMITFMHIVLGELVPKSVAIARPESSALFSAGPLKMFYQLFYPFIWALNTLANNMLRLFHINPANEADLAHSEEELRMLVSASHEGGVLDEMESELIDNVFDFADHLAREIMIPRQDMVCLYTDDTLDDIFRVVKQYGHTRYPLCEEDKDHVIGLIHTRDLMLMLREPSIRDLRQLMHEVLVVPESMSVARVLQEMKRRRTHMAVVADEYGGTAGLITVEDILEEIVGDIYDEHDQAARPEIQRLGDNTYEFDGKVLVEDVSEILHLDLEDPDEDTIGGFVFGRLGRRPEVGDKVKLNGHCFEVVEAQGFRITRVRASLDQPVAEALVRKQTPANLP